MRNYAILSLGLSWLVLGCGAASDNRPAPGPHPGMADNPLAIKLKSIPVNERAAYIKQHPKEVQAAMMSALMGGKQR